MNLPKSFFRIASILLLFSNYRGFSQKDSSFKIFKFSVDAAFITNAAYSHYTEPSSTSRFTTETISKNNNSLNYLPGFSLGATSLFGKANRGEFVFGITCALTNSNYHYYFSSYEEGVGYSGSSHITEKNRVSSFVNLNFEIGYRFRVSGKFRLQPSCLINQNLVTFQKENGFTRSVTFAGLNYPSGFVYTYYNETTEPIHSNRKFRSSTRASIRLTAVYLMKIGAKQYSIFGFRNFGIKYHQPCWAIGLSRFF